MVPAIHHHVEVTDSIFPQYAGDSFPTVKINRLVQLQRDHPPIGKFQIHPSALDHGNGSADAAKF